VWLYLFVIGLFSVLSFIEGLLETASDAGMASVATYFVIFRIAAY
jgi:hypothetical protein